MGIFKLLTLILIMIFFSGVGAFAKRVAPAEIKAVVKSGIEYSTERAPAYCRSLSIPCGMQIDVIAKNVKTKKNKWRIEILRVIYDHDLETDVQDVYPSKMTIEKNQLVILDESGLKYILDLKTGAFVEPTKAITYNRMKK